MGYSLLASLLPIICAVVINTIKETMEGDWKNIKNSSGEQ